MIDILNIAPVLRVPVLPPEDASSNIVVSRPRANSSDRSVGALCVPVSLGGDSHLLLLRHQIVEFGVVE
jgi:hypothetical protein